MAGIPFKTRGKVYTRGGRTAFLLSRTGEPYTLREAYVILGTEEEFLPETLLDDWGHEISGPDLYLWVKENAAYFPRAEVFGFDLSGRPRQYFVRELEVTSKFALYAYQGPDNILKDATRLDAILVAGDEPGKRRLLEAPKKISFPLRMAAVEWWLVNSTLIASDDLDLLLQSGGV